MFHNHHISPKRFKQNFFSFYFYLVSFFTFFYSLFFIILCLHLTNGLSLVVFFSVERFFLSCKFLYKKLVISFANYTFNSSSSTPHPNLSQSFLFLFFRKTYTSSSKRSVFHILL